MTDLSDADLEQSIADEWVEVADWLKAAFDEVGGIGWPAHVIADQRKKLAMLQRAAEGI